MKYCDKLVDDEFSRRGGSSTGYSNPHIRPNPDGAELYVTQSNTSLTEALAEIERLKGEVASLNEEISSLVMEEVNARTKLDRVSASLVETSTALREAEDSAVDLAKDELIREHYMNRDIRNSPPGAQNAAYKAEIDHLRKELKRLAPYHHMNAAEVGGAYHQVRVVQSLNSDKVLLPIQDKFGVAVSHQPATFDREISIIWDSRVPETTTINSRVVRHSLTAFSQMECVDKSDLAREISKRLATQIYQLIMKDSMI
jgi:regulator of replication initiation timing